MLNEYIKKQQVTNAEMVEYVDVSVSVSVVSLSVLAAEPCSGSSVGVGVSSNICPDSGPGSGPSNASREQKTLGQQRLAQQIPRGKGQECSSSGIRNDQA